MEWFGKFCTQVYCTCTEIYVFSKIFLYLLQENNKYRSDLEEIKMTLEETLAQIKPLDKNAMDVAAKRWDSIAKPLHSLGKMENW